MDSVANGSTTTPESPAELIVVRLEIVVRLAVVDKETIEELDEGRPDIAEEAVVLAEPVSGFDRITSGTVTDGEAVRIIFGIARSDSVVVIVVLELVMVTVSVPNVDTSDASGPVPTTLFRKVSI